MPGESPCKRWTLRRGWVGPGPRARGDGADGCRWALIWVIGQPSAVLDVIADVVFAVVRRCFDLAPVTVPSVDTRALCIDNKGIFFIGSRLGRCIACF